MQKTPATDGQGFLNLSRKAQPVLDAKALELVLEARDTAATVKLLRAAGPGRVRARINVQVQLVAFLAVGRAGLVFGSICHHDGDEVVIGMAFGFHRLYILRVRGLKSAGLRGLASVKFGKRRHS